MENLTTNFYYYFPTTIEIEGLCDDCVIFSAKIKCLIEVEEWKGLLGEKSHTVDLGKWKVKLWWCGIPWIDFVCDELDVMYSIPRDRCEKELKSLINEMTIKPTTNPDILITGP